MRNTDVKTALIVLVSVMAGMFLAQSAGLRVAQGQSEGQAGGMICVTGQAGSRGLPIVLVDVPDRTVLVYEYSYANNTLEFVSARSFQYDRLSKQFNVKGPTVEEVQRSVAPR